MGRKTGTKSVIPLHGMTCHREGPQSYHRLGERQFCKVHGLNLPALVKELNARWKIVSDE